MIDVKLSNEKNGGEEGKELDAHYLESRAIQQRVLERIKNRVRDDGDGDFLKLKKVGIKREKGRGRKMTSSNHSNTSIPGISPIIQKPISHSTPISKGANVRVGGAKGGISYDSSFSPSSQLSSSSSRSMSENTSTSSKKTPSKKGRGKKTVS